MIDKTDTVQAPQTIVAAPGEPKATKARLQDRQASPDVYMTSGLERAMGAQADKMHSRTLPTRKR